MVRVSTRLIGLFVSLALLLPSNALATYTNVGTAWPRPGRYEKLGGA